MAALEAKLATFDAGADSAVRFIRRWLDDGAGDLVTLARGRHVWGHYRYGDRNLLEWDDGQLLAAAAEELADAIVYLARYLELAPVSVRQGDRQPIDGCE